MHLSSIARFAGVSAIAAGSLLASPAAQAQGTFGLPESEYRYQLTWENAADCALTQQVLQSFLQESDPARAQLHQAMAQTWIAYGSQLKGSQLSDEDAQASLGRLNAQLTHVDGESGLEDVRPLARPCEILETLHWEEYRDVAAGLVGVPDVLFASDQPFKLQDGSDPVDLPSKNLTFGGWTFTSNRNWCTGTYTFDDGAELKLNFNNFGEGEFLLNSERLPVLDSEAEGFEQLVEQHRQGLERANFRDSFAQGINAENFSGSGVFADGELIAGLSGNVPHDSGYSFGKYFQGYYYSDLAGAKEISVRVLGEETHRATFPDAAFWNEMTRCVAQYPYG